MNVDFSTGGKGPSAHLPTGVRGEGAQRASPSWGQGVWGATGTPTWDLAKSVSELKTGDRRLKIGFAR